MSRIMFAWELGGNYGHVSGFLPIARKLRARGYDVPLVVRDLAVTERLVGEDKFECYQAPVYWLPQDKIPAAINYSGILINCGFALKNDLLARVKAWARLYDWIKPDLIICDHAPTAIVTARVLSIPYTILGTGFYSPPQVNPMPSIRPWMNIPKQHFIANDQTVLNVINQVLEEFNSPALETLANLLDAAENFLCTLPELDHYRERGEVHYWGPTFNINEGIEPYWPDNEKPKIFAYLSIAYPMLELLLQQLRSSAFQCLAYVSGITTDLVKKYATENLQFIPQPANLAQVAKCCDLILCHGGHGTVAASLLAGRPVLTLPMHLEQLLVSVNIKDHYLGTFIHPDNKKPNYKKTIKQLLSESAINREVKAFSVKYREFTPEQQEDSIVDRCEEILRKRSQLST